jgi:hypothetical protein
LMPIVRSHLIVRSRTISPSRPAVPREPSRADAVKVGRRSNIEARSAIARPHLDGVEHGGRIGAHRDDGRDLDA